jgi:N-formylglutamate deformylase
MRSRPLHKTSLPGIYTLSRPDQGLPLIFDSPHSGTDYPDDFGYACDFGALEMAEDKFVDDLFAAAPAYGATLLSAHFPRSYIDANRCETDVDPELLAGLWPEEITPSARSDAGIGLIRRLVRPGLPVYSRSLSIEEVQRRIETYYRPYHDTLGRLMDEAHYRHGQVWHVNCHSMPPQSAFAGSASMFRAYPAQNADFVLGDRDGTSCSLDFTHALRDHLRHQGYKVAINDPYKGVELVARYSDPARGRHSIQIEICKSLYLEEDLKTKSKNYSVLQSDIEAMIEFCADYVRAQALPLAAD